MLLKIRPLGISSITVEIQLKIGLGMYFIVRKNGPNELQTKKIAKLRAFEIEREKKNETTASLELFNNHSVFLCGNEKRITLQ